MKIKIRFPNIHTLCFVKGGEIAYETDFKQEEADFTLVRALRNNDDDATVLVVRDENGCESGVLLYDETPARYNPIILSIETTL